MASLHEMAQGLGKRLPRNTSEWPSIDQWSGATGGEGLARARARCDLVARTILAPIELPVGIVTALIGGPFFLWLLVRQP